MAPRKQNDKQELVNRLAGYRNTVKIPDKKQLLSQSKKLLQVAAKLPTTMNGRPARNLMVTAGVTCLLVILLKPKRKKKKDPLTAPAQSISRQLFTFSLTVTQPLVRVWLTERTRQWLQK